MVDSCQALSTRPGRVDGKISSAHAIRVALSAIGLLLTHTAVAQTLPLKTILAFNRTNGANPEDSLVADGSGVLYGTTSSGGGGSGGVAFKLSPPAKGKTGWVAQTLHAFAGNSDGYDPLAPVTLHNGVVYGTTFLGGSGPNGCYADGLGCGTVFKLAPPTGTVKTWTYTVLHRFSPVQSANDGAMPIGGVYVDANGNVFGTTSQGGGTSCDAPGTGCGVLYEITAAGTYSILYRFQGGADANNPGFSLTLGVGGVLYGASQFGGSTGSTCVWGSLGCGTIFRLTPNGTSFSESVLYRFTGGNDGSNPGAPVALDGSGTLYGTTSFGGAGKDGVVFRLKPPTAGASVWVEDVLHAFTGGADGASPGSPLLISAGTALIGTTSVGGGTGCAASEGCGLVFKLVAPANSTTPWILTSLHNFTGGVDGGESSSGLLPMSNGVLYGTSLVGGTSSDSGGTGYGTVFALGSPANCMWEGPCKWPF